MRAARRPLVCSGVLSLALLASASTAPAPALAAEDWPSWRGARGDGTSREPLADAPWPAAGPKVAWRAKAGAGYASPVAAGGRVLLFHLADGHETLTAYDAATGKVAWSDGGPGGFTASYAGTRATPLIHGDRVYTLGGLGELVARDLATGKRQWSIDVLAVTATQPLKWGCAANLLLDGDVLYAQTGEGGPVAIAVRRADGKVLWRASRTGNAGYAQPVLVERGGSRLLLVFSGESLDALDPATGEARFSHLWKTKYGVNAATPIHRGGQVFITSAYGKGAALLALPSSPATAPVTLWENKDAQARFNPPILDEDGEHLYLNSEGELVCLRWKDGAIVWTAGKRELELGIGGSLVRAGDKLVTFGDRGTLSVLRATPAGWKKLAQARTVAGTELWAAPLLYQGRVYVRGEGELVAYALEPAKAPKAAKAAQ